MKLDQLLEEKREDILRIAAEHGAREVRVFGSVARGEADRESDIDDFGIQETLSVEEAYRPAIRDQGFR